MHCCTRFMIFSKNPPESASTPLLTTASRAENPRLKFPLFRDRYTPVMEYRCPHYCSNGHVSGSAEHRMRMADWAVKNRMNVELERMPPDAVAPFYRVRGGCIMLGEYPGHNFHQLIPPEKYFKDHPDFFPLERATGRRRTERAQLCTSNPALIREIGGPIADAYFKRNQDHTHFPLFQEDGDPLRCQCDTCLALTPIGSNLVSAADQNIHVANRVGAEIRKRHPDKQVITYAYGITSPPPQG